MLSCSHVAQIISQHRYFRAITVSFTEETDGDHRSVFFFSKICLERFKYDQMLSVMHKIIILNNFQICENENSDNDPSTPV